MHKIIILSLNLFLSFTVINCDFQLPLVNNFGSKDEKLKAEKQTKLPPCKSCTIFVESFKKVLKRKIFNHFPTAKIFKENNFY